MKTSTATHENPFRDPKQKPEWAQLTRLAGDRAAILFEDLRRRLSKIDGLREELFYHGPEWGWGPRYKAGERILFTARILAGTLQTSLNLEGPLRERVLASSRVASGMKEMIRRAPLSQGKTAVRLCLARRSDVRSFANLVSLKSTLLVSRESKSSIKQE